MQLAEEYEKKGLSYIRTKLKQLDPVTYGKVDLNNHLRILKALEISIQTGRPYSDFLTHSKKKRDFNIIKIALEVERDTLYDRINERVDEMVRSGLVSEVSQLKQYRKTNAMKTVGYKEIFEYLDGDLTLEESIQRIKNNTRKYARKQITWFRKNNAYHWMNPKDLPAIITLIEQSTR